MHVEKNSVTTVLRRRRVPSIGEQELKWRVAAAFLLAAGVLSLTLSWGLGSWTAADHVTAGFPMWESSRVSHAIGKDWRTAMSAQERLADTSARRWQGASSYSADDPILHPLPSGAESRSQVAGYADDGMSGILTQMEEWIRQYPWPTVLIGIGLGFVLARRMRW